MNAQEIAEKYVYGNHDALTDNQEVKDMTVDITNFATEQNKELVDAYEEKIKEKDRIINNLIKK